VTTALLTAGADAENFPMKFIKRFEAASAAFELQLAKGTQFLNSKEARKGEVKTWFSHLDSAWKEAEACVNMVNLSS